MTAVALIPVWTDRAACRGNPGPFFGPDIESETERERREAKAKRICAACPVFRNCRASIEARPTKHGVWAGENFNDRDNRHRREKRRIKSQDAA